MGGFPTGAVTVRVPATSANLGPGFDALGLALQLYDVVTAEVVAGSGAPTIRVDGEGAGEVPLDASHLVHSALATGLEILHAPVPAIRLECRNAIPHGRGLGSSAAAVVAGLSLARRLVADGEDRLSDEALLDVAAGLEGHPDNVSAALLGGLTIAYGGVQGKFHAVRLDPPPTLRCVVCIPPTPLRTEVARTLLPEQVPHADAAHNAARAALLVAALTGLPEVLLPATADRLHQRYREPAMPRSLELVEALRGRGIAAVVSGAGPTVLALGADRVAIPDDLAPDGWRVVPLHVDRNGATAQEWG